MQIIFWISLILLFYTYLGYGLGLVLLNTIFKKPTQRDNVFLPPVTFLVAAYNEEDIIEKKIKNSLDLNYPADKIYFLFITDGSADNTVNIIKKYPLIHLLHQGRRQGKSAALNRAMRDVVTPVVVFSDANTMLHEDSLLKLVQHYQDEKVGGVSGEKRILDKDGSAVGFGERLYWLYESLLKKANADFYTIIGAAGELFSIRSALYKPLNENIILDDFVISAQVCQQGYQVLYEKEAIGVETSSSSIKEERKRKVRISAGCFQAFFLLKGLLNPFKNWKICFQYVSHRVLRWMLCPLLLPIVFLTNAFLYRNHQGSVYTYLFFAQSAFYALALLGWLYTRRKASGNIFLVAYYFVFMILSQYAGFFRFLTKRQSVLWEKAERKTFSETGSFSRNIL